MTEIVKVVVLHQQPSKRPERPAYIYSTKDLASNFIADARAKLEMMMARRGSSEPDLKRAIEVLAGEEANLSRRRLAHRKKHGLA
jgi:hypothetical protein